MTRIRLCRAVRRRLDEMAAACGERSRPFDLLLGVLDAERFGPPGEVEGTGRLWLFDDRPEADFARAEAICEATGAVVIHSGSRVTVYQYGRDKITRPARYRYRSLAAYYTTRFHLTMHWAEERLGWEGDAAHAKLVAVLGSYLLAEAAGIPVRDLGTYREFQAEWLRRIRRTPEFLRRALGEAVKATDFLLSLGNPSREFAPMRVVKVEMTMAFEGKRFLMIESEGERMGGQYSTSG